MECLHPSDGKQVNSISGRSIARLKTLPLKRGCDLGSEKFKAPAGRCSQPGYYGWVMRWWMMFWNLLTVYGDYKLVLPVDQSPYLEFCPWDLGSEEFNAPAGRCSQPGHLGLSDEVVNDVLKFTNGEWRLLARFTGRSIALLRVLSLRSWWGVIKSPSGALFSARLFMAEWWGGELCFEIY